MPRKTVHKGRFDRVHELCFNILTSLEDIAVKRRHNFILDQVKTITNHILECARAFKKKKNTCIYMYSMYICIYILAYIYLY